MSHDLAVAIDAVACWLLTFAIHGTLLLGAALLAGAWLSARATAWQELLLRIALLAPVATSLLQWWLLGGPWDLVPAFAAAGAAMDVRDTASYALHQIDLARRALTAAGQDAAGDAGLTARETQVLRLIADGGNTREISERLFISAKTTDNHIQHIYIKLDVTNRAAATRWAFDHDVFEAGDPK